MPLYEYNCPDGHTVEVRQGIEVKSILCPACGKPALRAEFYREQTVITETGRGSGYGLPRSNEAYTKNGNYAVSRFQEATQELDYNHKKAEESAQRELPSKNLYKEGLKRAEKLGAKINGRTMASIK